MKNRFLLQDAIGLIDDAIILEASDVTAIRKRLKIQRALLRAASILVVFALLLPITVSIIHQIGNPSLPITDPTKQPTPYSPYVFNALETPTKLDGISSANIHGNSSLYDTNNSPPSFCFELGGINVKAKLIEVLPDTYGSQNSRSTSYRLLRFRTLEVICGENIPETFLYRIPASKLVDMSYDCLYMSIKQLGTERYVMYNKSQECFERFDEILFYDNYPELGNVIAFTDGIFDESLWQNDSWLYGYQFGKWALDQNYEDLYVYRGCTEEYTKNKMKTDIEKFPQLHEPLSPDYMTFSTQEDQEAFDYVTDFKNGVFLQEDYSRYSVTFRRYINGCPTDETIRFDSYNNAVIYSESRYTEEELKTLENIAIRVEEQAESYRQNFPLPEHIDTEGKSLRGLSVFGWYAKKNGTVYGIVQTRWIYTNKIDNRTYRYTDEAFTVYDAANKLYQQPTRDELIELVGVHSHLYQYHYGYEYGSPEEVPQY